MKRLMILGAGPNQIPLIKAAKKNGYYVIVCDFNENAPGVELADELCTASILDKDAILSAAKMQKLDGITSNSEPAMNVVAYVGNTLGLPSNSYRTVCMLTNKVLFRTFLKEKGFNVPDYGSAESYEEAEALFDRLTKPVMLKPAASSGSRGVVKLTDKSLLRSSFEAALSFSRTDQVIIEEYIENSCHSVIGGELFAQDRGLVFAGLMSSVRGSYNPYVPAGEIFPAQLSTRQHDSVIRELRRAVKELDLSLCAINVECIIDTHGKVYLIELNPRNGGNYLPEQIEMATGFDIFDATVRAAVGEKVAAINSSKRKTVSTYQVHSRKAGSLKKVHFSDQLSRCIVSYIPERVIGDAVEPFINAEKRIGTLFLSFNSDSECNEIMNSIESHITVSVE